MNIMLIAAMSGGEIKKTVCEEICKSNAYYKTVMKILKNNQEMETVFGQQPRTMIIRKDGIRAIEDQIPWLRDEWMQGHMIFRKERSERKANISQTIYNAQLCDIPWLPLEKSRRWRDEITDDSPYEYYAPVEIKGADEIRGSRMHGLITGNNRLIFMYNFADKNKRYPRVMEEKTKGYIRQRTKIQYVESVIFTDDIEKLFDNIEMNTEINIKMMRMHNNQNKNKDLVLFTDPFNIIPNGKLGTLYLKTLLYPSIIDSLIDKLKAEERMPILSLIPVSLPVCNQIKNEQREVGVICLSDQKEIVKNLNPGNHIHTFSVPGEMLEEYISREIETRKSEINPGT